MTLDNIVFNKKNNFKWTLFHLLLGLVSTITPFAIIFWFFFILVTSLHKAFKGLSKGQLSYLLFLFAYLVSFEMLARMSNTSPYLPYEIGKYFLIFFSIVGLLTLGVKNGLGLLLVVVITPSIFYDLSGSVVTSDIINYFLAPLGIGLSLAFTNKSRVTQNNFNDLLRLVWLTSLSALFFAVIKTPDFENIEFTLGAQSQTTGGQSSNQVSTILGLGFFLSVYSIREKLKFSGNYYLDIVFGVMFFFQTLLSFSRGGLIVAIIGVFIYLYPEIKRVKTKFIFFSLITLIGIVLLFAVANNLSNGLLLQRYAGETEGTIGGYKEKDFDVVTSGRLTILQEDIDLWKDYPILGVGCGASSYMRSSGDNIAPHMEFSRLVAEAGILGLLYFLILLRFMYKVLRRNKISASKQILFAIFVIAILTSFHSAMRTYMTPLLLILASLTVVPIINEKSITNRSR
jgi:O-antigen ligase